MVLFFIVVYSHRAHAEALTRRPRHSVPRYHLSLADCEKGRPLPRKRKNHCDCCFFLSFLGMYARTLLFFGLLRCPSRCVIVFLAPLILRLRAHTEIRKKGGRVHFCCRRARIIICARPAVHTGITNPDMECIKLYC